MDTDVKTLLEWLLAGQIIDRSKKFRAGWRLDFYDRVGRDANADEMPPDSQFLDQAIAEFRNAREHILKQPLS